MLPAAAGSVQAWRQQQRNRPAPNSVAREVKGQRTPYPGCQQIARSPGQRKEKRCGKKTSGGKREKEVKTKRCQCVLKKSRAAQAYE